MATNKRKDAAALFELLDNSSLKVPKNAANLKIPSWWSSKINPSPKPDVDNLADISFEENGGVVTKVDAEPSRLFDPPPSGEAPEATPSIRPPAVQHGPEPSQPDPIGIGSAPVSTIRPARATPHVVSPPKPPIDPSIPVAPREPKIFAPQMYAQQRRPWVKPRPGAFARTPTWVFGAGVAAIFILVVGIVVVARSGNKNALASPVTPEQTAVQPPAPTPTVVPVNNSLRTTPAPAAPTRATWYKPGDVQRDRSLYYVIIASTRAKDVAERNAKFIADNGVSVSVEVDKGGWYHLISVDGFASNSAAKPLRDRIVQIGHLTEAYKKDKRAWDDARVQNNLSAPK